MASLTNPPAFSTTLAIALPSPAVAIPSSAGSLLDSSPSNPVPVSSVLPSSATPAGGQRGHPLIGAAVFVVVSFAPGPDVDTALGIQRAGLDQGMARMALEVAAAYIPSELLGDGLVFSLSYRWATPPLIDVHV